MSHLLMPEGSIESMAITQFINQGPFKNRLIKILDSEDLTVTEISNDEYIMVRDLLLSTGVDFKVVVNIPDVESPQSFLFEDNIDKVVSYDLIEFKDKSDGEKFLASLASGGLPESDEAKEEE